MNYITIVSHLVMPLMIGAISVYALSKKTAVFDSFIEGGSDGLKNAVMIAPSVMGLVVGVTMLRESGAIDFVSDALRVITDRLHIPGETVPLLILRPISGSGSLALLNDILLKYGADSFAGKVASTVMGGTDTTFYAIAVYLGAAGIHKKSAKIIISALLCDLVCFIVSVVVWRWFM